MSAQVIAIREGSSPVGPLKWKKGPDFDFNGEWIITAPSGKTTVVAFSRDFGAGSWYRANAGLAPPGTNHTIWGYLGDSKEEVTRKLQDADHPAWSDKA